MEQWGNEWFMVQRFDAPNDDMAADWTHLDMACKMVAPSPTLIHGLCAFDHTVIVGDETVLTLALYMEGVAFRLTYCPSGELVFRGHAVKPPSAIVNSSLPYGSLTRRLPTGDRVFFQPCPDSPDKEYEASGPETFVVQSASCLSIETKTLVTCQGELSITLMDMDRIFGLPISGHLYDEVSPMVAGFTYARSLALPYSCHCLFLAYHHLFWSSKSNTLSTTAWVEFWFRTEDNVVPVHDPWTAWHALYGIGVATPRGRTTVERDVFDFLRVIPGKEDKVHLAALLSVWLSRFVFRSTGGDDLRPMVFKVASFMATGVRFALASPALACLYRGLGHAAAGTSSMAQWPYLYSWLAIYFHTHGEDLDGIRRPGMISFGNPSLRRTFIEEQACDLFQRLPVSVWHRYVLGANDLYSLVDEPKKLISRQHFESILSICCCSLTVRCSIHFFVEPYYPIRFARQLGYCQDLPGDLGARANQWEATSLSELQNRLEPEPTVSAAVGSEEEEVYDSDRFHPHKRRPKGKKPIGKKEEGPSHYFDRGFWFRVKEEEGVCGSSAHFSPFATDVVSSDFGSRASCRASAFLSKLELNPPETVHISSSLEASEVPQEEESQPTSTVQIGSCIVSTFESTEVVEVFVEVAPSSTQLETLPIQEVAPPVVQEAAEETTIEKEAPSPFLQEGAPTPSVEEVVEVEALTVREKASVVQEEAPTPAVEAPVPAIEDVVEVVQEEIPVAVEEIAEVIPAVVGVAEVILAIEEDSIVQNTTTSPTLPTPPASISLATPSQQLLSHVEGVMLQAWKDQITHRMLSPDAVRDTSLAADADFIIKSLVGEKASRTSRDWSESDARDALDALSSKLENAEITLGEAAEELSEAKVDEEDARERLKLGREKLQSDGTKVVYHTTQVEQIQESVRDLKKAVVEAEQKVAEVIARSTHCAAEEATLLSSRAAFVELQQEMARGL
ncbi:hypothetical protein H6P81_002933 [Aristolochia fimbriata]|uniref:Aminotransferase-like plant mobile domain-containing protein n=1 Tax=Aristolochia fimbriata TaxID=158543 RepID=A0AAV7FE22_ARIFI|nr:hypothetical protein H6P81_002933 [Aristolochia fimbriata]